MSTSVLKRLVIGHLRGSVIPFSLPFDKAKKLTVIYGENATGKTTICDAFQFLAHGTVGSLEDRGLGRTNKYWHSLGKSAADISVTLETGSASCTGILRNGEVVAAPAESRPRVEVLRRNQITRLVEARPAERYAEIGRFIDVSGIEASEATLRELVRNLNKNRDTAVAIVHENEQMIHQFWDSAGKPQMEPIKWAEQESNRDLSGLQADQQALGKLRSAYLRIADFPEKFAAITKSIDAARDTANSAARHLEGILANTAEGASEMVRILEAAKPYLEKHLHPANCPLCESTEKVVGLRERVESRIGQFVSLQKATREKQVTDDAVQIGVRRLAELKNDLARDNQAFEAAKAAHKWQKNVPLPQTPCPENLAALIEWVTSTSVLASEWQKIEAATHSQNQFVNTLKQALKKYKSNVQAQKDLDELLPRLDRALEIVVEERRKFTDGRLQSIAAQVGALYEKVHPGEGLNKISLELDPNKRASLDIGATFGGQAGTPPQAYFSQSHLDTLGLCIFLALASLDKPEETTLVLDDILASVDEPHVERLIEMLHAEVLQFRHCVVTTHYRPWKEKLRWGWLQNGQCHFVELTKWTAANGLQLIRSIPDFERLRQILAEVPPDPQLVCAKAGVILEAALDFLTVLYQCRVPRRPDGRYTLGDLLPALNKKLRDSLKVEVFSGNDASGKPQYKTIVLAPILEELTRIAQVRNVFGAHFNELSFQLLDADAIGFGQQVLNLMDALTDPEAGWPRSSKSGSYWANAGESRRLHPLQQPA